ncbi:MAG: hypothetical protein IT271_13445 [Chitinophagales bacterium]|nr:hypothetical protein [Chitinophagales bacterium]
MQKEKNKIKLEDKITNWVSTNLFYSFMILVLIIFIIILSVFGITALIYKDKTILNPNEIGDTIGGLTAPIIGLFSAFLVYIAFKEQVKANKELQKQNTHNVIGRYTSIIESIKLETESFKINSNNGVYSTSRYITGIKSIEHIFNLLNPIDFHRANKYLVDYYEEIIRIYLLSLSIISEIKTLDTNINDKLYLLNKLNFLKTTNLPEIQVDTIFNEGTFGESEYKLKIFIKENLLKILNEFNIEYNNTYQSYISKLVNPLPKIIK